MYGYLHDFYVIVEIEIKDDTKDNCY